MKGVFKYAKEDDKRRFRSAKSLSLGMPPVHPLLHQQLCDAPEIEPCTVIIHARYTAEIKDSRYDITTQLYKYK